MNEPNIQPLTPKVKDSKKNSYWNRFKTLRQRVEEKTNKDGATPTHVADLVGKCWEWIGATCKGGYGVIQVKGEPQPAHRIAWTLHNGDIEPASLFVLHKCDNRRCINPDHLFLGTSQDNRSDCLNKNRVAFGETSGNSKLKEAEVLEIKRRPHSYGIFSRLGREFGVHHSTVARIRKGETWVGAN